MCRFAHTIATPDMKDKDEVKSKEWTCAICLEIPKFFGVLIGCNHPFCMPCLKRWRDKQSKEHYLRESTVIKGCPVCREPSRFIVPSAVFPETEDQKKALIEDYKDSTQKTHCRYFQKSNGIDRRCPFGDDCLFGHRDSNGNKVLNVLRPPSRQSQRISNPFSSLFGPSIHIFHGPRMVPAFRYLSEILDGLSEDEDEDSDFEDDWA
ncbi:hypothetical protein BC829DRAFT_404744 [Chytridium lagenaria]|nr:hypothetical protein BC829DRAFT_404744 [Chytridium lagenaria]